MSYTTTCAYVLIALYAQGLYASPHGTYGLCGSDKLRKQRSLNDINRDNNMFLSLALNQTELTV